MAAASAEPDLAALLQFAHELADAAADVTLRYFRRSGGIEDKGRPGRYDPVTAADREAEQAMRRGIKARFPDHGILGEEHGEDRGASPWVWVIDPIDGTRSFISGIPLWGTLIALNAGGAPILGIMDQPYLGERFVGSPSGAWLRKDGAHIPLRTRGQSDLGSAVLLCTDPAMFAGPGEREAFDRLGRAVRLVRYGTDCYGYCMLASGLADLVVEADLKPYDIQALMPIVEQAGGIVTDWEGGHAHHGGRVVAAGDPTVHAAALAVLASAAR